MQRHLGRLPALGLLVATTLVVTTSLLDGHGPAARTLSADDAGQVAGRVLVVYDLEGASGAVEHRRERIVQDVSAVVAGFFDGGAGGVHVLNTHGDGDPNLVPAARLDPRVVTLLRREGAIGPWLDPYSPENTLVAAGAYDAVAAVGMHGKPLSGGYSPHTIGVGLSPVINGTTLTETELIAYAFGTVGIPVILVSGDDRLQRDLGSTMPWLEYVIVKRATGPNTTDPLPVERVQEELRAAAARAWRNLGHMRALALRSPIRAGLLPTFPAALPIHMGDLPGLEVRDDTVTFVAPDYRVAYRGIRALMVLARGHRSGAHILEFLRQRPELREVLRELQDSANAQWTRFEQQAQRR